MIYYRYVIYKINFVFDFKISVTSKNEFFETKLIILVFKDYSKQKLFFNAIYKWIKTNKSYPSDGNQIDHTFQINLYLANIFWIKIEF